MEFSSTRLATGKQHSKAAISAAQLITLYLDAPQEEISLDEFELFALDRLSLLRGIETLKARGFEEKEFNSNMTKVCIFF